MEAITTEADFKSVISQPALTSIFLDDGLSPHITSEILSTWKGFNELSKHRWNLLFPVFPENPPHKGSKNAGAYRIDGDLHPDKYDIALAKNIAWQLKLPSKHFPALVFIGHDSSDYFILPLTSKSGSSWRQHFRKISSICANIEAELERTGSIDYYKVDTVRSVRRYLALHSRFVKLGPALGFFANLLGVPSSAVSLAE